MVTQQAELEVVFKIYSLEWVLSEKNEDNTSIDRAIDILGRAKLEIDPYQKIGLVDDAKSMLEEVTDPNALFSDNPAWVSYITSLDDDLEAELDYAKIQKSSYFIEIRRPLSDGNNMYVAEPFSDKRDLDVILAQAEIWPSGAAINNAFGKMLAGKYEVEGYFSIYEPVRKQSNWVAGIEIVASSIILVTVGTVVGTFVPDALKYAGIASELANIDPGFFYSASELLSHRMFETEIGRTNLYLNSGSVVGGSIVGLGSLIKTFNSF